MSFEEDPDTAEAADLEDHDLQQVLLSYEESDEDEWEVDRVAAEEDAYLDTIMRPVSEGNDEDEWEMDRVAAEEDAYLDTIMDEHAWRPLYRSWRPPRRTGSDGTPEPSERLHRAQRQWWAEKAKSKQPAKKKKTAPRTSRLCPNPKCKKKVRATASYCKSCGIRLDNYCPNPKCNKRVQKTANYCDGCGHQLKS